MTVKELDELIDELKRRIGPNQVGPDPIASEFLGQVLNALQEYRELRHWTDKYGDVSRDRWGPGHP